MLQRPCTLKRSAFVLPRMPPCPLLLDTLIRSAAYSLCDLSLPKPQQLDNLLLLSLYTFLPLDMPAMCNNYMRQGLSQLDGAEAAVDARGQDGSNALGPSHEGQVEGREHSSRAGGLTSGGQPFGWGCPSLGCVAPRILFYSPKRPAASPQRRHMTFEVLLCM